jgi:hypothetical protein
MKRIMVHLSTFKVQGFLMMVGLITVYCLLTPAVFASSTIATNNSMAYGANIGWMDWRGDETNGCVGCTNGVVVSEFVLKGYIYSANVGWISLGNGNPTNGVQYTNLSTNDFGVNNLGTGELRGFGYGANIGWVVFTNRSATGLLLSSEVPHFDLATGNFSGYAYSANCGWIGLSNAFAFVKTDFCVPGADSDGDDITDAWELQYAANLTVLSGAGHDQDGDGVSDVNEYLADTNPMDPNDKLRITAIAANSGGSTSTVTWTSHPTRLYQVQSRNDLVTGAWGTNSPPGVVIPDLGLTTTRDAPGAATSNRFFRVQAIRPLKP